MRMIVTGPAGLLGPSIVREFGRDHEVTPLTRADLDLTDASRVCRTIGDLAPSVIINCAGYTDVDGAEDDPQAAFAGNAFAVHALARAASEVGATLVQYSTDFVFDGTASRPYVEEDEPHPKSIYAMSKLVGEWFAADVPSHYILRIESLFDGASPRGTMSRIVGAVLDGREVHALHDRVISPAFTTDIATTTRMLLERRPAPGLYHAVNSGMATWLEIAREVARQLGRDVKLMPESIADVRMKAPRPTFSALSNDKLARAGIMMPSWQDALRRYLASRKQVVPSVG